MDKWMVENAVCTSPPVCVCIYIYISTYVYVYVCMVGGWMDKWMAENAVFTSGLCCLQGNRQRRRASVDSQQ